MSFGLAAVFCQPAATQGGGGGDECDLYIRPAPTAISTNLDKVPVFQPSTSVNTDLCAEVI